MNQSYPTTNARSLLVSPSGCQDGCGCLPNLERKFVGLAPMEGITDFPARIWFGLAARWDVLCTPFLRVTDDYPLVGGVPLGFCPELTHLKGYMPVPLIPQLMTTSGVRFAQVAEEILGHSSVVDLNCGCPAPKVVGKGAGSALLSVPDLLGKLVTDIAARLGPGVLSVKIRTGFHCDGEFAGLLDRLQNVPLFWLNVHGRTRQDRYQGTARWEHAIRAGERLPYPVVGSGDIVNVEKFSSLFNAPSPLRGVFIGRGAARNPWLVQELRTGVPVAISFDLLKTAINVYAYLAHAASVDSALLVDVCKELDFSQPCGDRLDRWQKVAFTLAARIAPVGTLHVSTRVLGRVKMMWRYLRTSLPPQFMNAALTRSATLPGFLDTLDEVHGACRNTNADDLLTLRHCPNHDHLFSGPSPAR